jgi:acyl-coenzyme A thioesterase PaaI-like protein
MELTDKDDYCYVCGSANELGLGVRFYPDGEAGSRASYTVRQEHTGWKGIFHGGLTFTLMDEGLGWALYYQGLRGVTAKSEVRFKVPILVGTKILVTASIVERARRLVRAEAKVRRDDDSNEVLAELTATMYLAPTP